MSRGKFFSKFFGFYWFPILLVWMSACTTDPAANEITSSHARITIVGKVELVPPLQPDLEQVKRWSVLGDEAMENAIYLVMGSDPTPPNPDKLWHPAWRGALKIELGKPFTAELPRHHNKLKGAVVHLDVLMKESMFFPGGLYFEVRPDADVVYIGTLRYTRNDFNVIKKVEVIDEYSEGAQFFASKHGAGFRMAKSLLKASPTR